jgi:rod shape determining protein RodA
VFGEVRMGAQRWIGIPGFGSVQPSEFLKIGMPLMIAWFLSRNPLPLVLKCVFITDHDWHSFYPDCRTT